MSRKSIAIIVLLAAALGVAGFGYWLTRSDAGRDFVLRQAQGSLPAGSRLQWKSVSGQLAGGLQFEQLVYTDATQRFEAGRIELSMRLSPLAPMAWSSPWPTPMAWKHRSRLLWLPASR